MKSQIPSSLKLYNSLVKTQKELQGELGFRKFQRFYNLQTSKEQANTIEDQLIKLKFYWHERFLINIPQQPKIEDNKQINYIRNYYESHKSSQTTKKENIRDGIEVREESFEKPNGNPQLNQGFNGKITKENTTTYLKDCFRYCYTYLTKSNQYSLVPFITYSFLPTLYDFDLFVYNKEYKNLYDFISLLTPNSTDKTYYDNARYNFKTFTQGLFQTPLFLGFLRKYYQFIFSSLRNMEDESILENKHISAIQLNWNKCLPHCPSYIYFFFSALKERFEKDSNLSNLSFDLFTDLFNRINTNPHIYSVILPHEILSNQYNYFKILLDCKNKEVVSTLYKQLFDSLLQRKGYEEPIISSAECQCFSSYDYQFLLPRNTKLDENSFKDFPCERPFILYIQKEVDATSSNSLSASNVSVSSANNGSLIFNKSQISNNNRVNNSSNNDPVYFREILKYCPNLPKMTEELIKKLSREDSQEWPIGCMDKKDLPYVEVIHAIRYVCLNLADADNQLYFSSLFESLSKLKLRTKDQYHPYASEYLPNIKDFMGKDLANYLKKIQDDLQVVQRREMMIDYRRKTKTKENSIFKNSQTLLMLLYFRFCANYNVYQYNIGKINLMKKPVFNDFNQECINIISTQLGNTLNVYKPQERHGIGIIFKKYPIVVPNVQDFLTYNNPNNPARPTLLSSSIQGLVTSILDQLIQFSFEYRKQNNKKSKSKSKTEITPEDIKKEYQERKNDIMIISRISYHLATLDLLIKDVLEVKTILNEMDDLLVETISQKTPKLTGQITDKSNLAILRQILYDEGDKLRKVIMETNVDPLQKAQMLNDAIKEIQYKFISKTAKTISDQSNFNMSLFILLNQSGMFKTYWILNQFIIEDLRNDFPFINDLQKVIRFTIGEEALYFIN